MRPPNPDAARRNEPAADEDRRTEMSLALIWWFKWPCEAGSCVEVAFIGDEVAVRDSKDPDGPVLRFTGAEWAAFVAGVKAGWFDRP
jgi:hypothetical protein